MNDNTPPQPLLRADHVCKTYVDGDVKALVDVTFSVAKGEYVAIMGPSGCGKSTLLNILGALDRPTSGEVYYDGCPLAGLPSLDQFRSGQLGFVFQSFFLLPTLTALENVQIPMFETTMVAAERLSRAKELIERVGMSHRANHLPNRLSVGERQRIAIARSLANSPTLILADEPTGNLDSRTTHEVLELFANLHSEKGVTLVIITHSEQVASVAQRIIRMKDGRVVGEEMTVKGGRLEPALARG